MERMINNITPADRWVSTDKGQPRDPGMYLVVKRNWLGKLAVQGARWNGEDWLTPEKRIEITPRVIFYMPLPEPPKEGDVENEAD